MLYIFCVLADDAQGFQLRLYCECGHFSDVSSFNFDISGMTAGRGDKAVLDDLTKQPPYILTMSIPQNVSSHLTSRKKRSTETKDTCTA